ncbi:MAG: asparagine synthase (glutamine-hydrolyzing) [Elusimicrobiota bacterium]
MCGIAGFAGLNNPELLRSLTAALAHRGPDDDGFFEDGPVGLGMRRLSIIDLSTGSQPIANEDGRYTVVFNGEIYNHKALRAELEKKGHRFRTAADTEAIVHLYEDLGAGCVRELRGMFALAVWDRKERSLFIARDRLGIKPLYYSVRGPRMYFASELRALMLVPEISHELDPDSIRQYADLLYVPSPHSILRSVNKLEPGSWLKWKDDKVSTGRYWSPPLETAAMDEEDALAELDQLSTAAVQEQKEADVPVGLFLSGGLDSSQLAAYLAASGAPPEAFSLRTGNPAFDETAKARRVAEHLGLRFQEVPVEPRPDLEAFAETVDEPLADSSSIATYWMADAVRGRMKVALTGIGGDELFGGYPRYLGAELHAAYGHLPRALREVLASAGGWSPDLLSSRNVGGWVRRFLDGGRRELPEAYRHWMGHDADGLFVEPPSGERRDPILQAFAASAGRGLDPLRRTLHADLCTYVPENLLALADRASMAASLELRVPLLDERLVEFACRLPSRLRVRGRTLKYLQKRLLRRFLPPDIISQKKQGFMVPMAQWLRDERGDLIDDCLSPSALRARGIFRPAAVRRIIDEHRSGKRFHTDLLWALILLELWQRRHLQAPPTTAGPRPLRLLVISDFHFADSEGGSARVAVETAKALADKGHEMTCWGTGPQDRPEQETRGSLRLRRAPLGFNPERAWGIPSFVRRAREHLAKAAAEARPDALIIHHPKAAWIAGGVPELAAVPRLYFFHSCWAREYQLDRSPTPLSMLGAWTRELLERSSLRAAGRVAVLSRFMQKEVSSHGVDPARIRLVAPGVDLDRFTPGPVRHDDALRLLTVRNLRPRMGLEALFDAAARLSGQFPNLRLTVAGFGPLRKPLEKRAAALGIGNNIDFTGWVEDAALPELYRNNDLFVLPTAAYEGLGLVLLEALACGMPVVGTPVGGIPEVIEGIEPSWLAAGTSAQDIAEALARAVPAAKDAQVRADCRSYAEGFSWAKTSDALEEALYALQG